MYLMGVAEFFSNIWMNIWISLNAMVYQLIEWLYEVFEVIANVNLFSREAFDDITGRLYVVIGIAMLFIFAYNIILMIINPEDKKNIGNTGKIVKETITALVLIILLPMIFNYMAIFQRNILDSHILEQIILGSTAGTGVKCDFSDMSLIDDYVKVKDDSAIKEMTDECNKYKSYKVSKQGAYSVAPTIFTAFFHPKYYSYDECVTYLKECNNKGTSCTSGKITTDDDKELCAHYVYSSNIGQFKGGIMPFTTTDNTVFSDAWSDKGLFDFNYLMALIAGCLGVWMFICYAMAIGVRVAKLGFLQIISPIPVMLRMIPKQKEKIYDKWFSHLLNAYLDVFMRLGIIYFCLFAISLVPDVRKSLFSSLEGDWFGTKALAAVIVILGILQFAQEAPALLKEFFGGSGAFALKSPKKQLADNKGLQSTINKARGFAGGTAALLTTKANQFRNFKNGNFEKEWKRKDATFGSRFKQTKDLLNPFAGYSKGYQYSKDSKNLDEWGYNVKRGAVDTLKDKGFVYKTRQSFSEIKDDLGNVIGKNYFTQDTKALQSKADAMQLIADQAKLIIGKIEDDAKFKGVASMFDSAIDNANKMNRPDLVSKITKEKVNALAEMRNALLVEKLQGREATVNYELDSDGVTKAIVSNLDKATKGISRELTSAVDNLNTALTDNFEKFSADIKDSEKELGIKFGDSMETNLTNLKENISDGNAKLIKNIKTVSEDMVASAKADIINMEKKDTKK